MSQSKVRRLAFATALLALCQPGCAAPSVEETDGDGEEQVEQANEALSSFSVGQIGGILLAIDEGGIAQGQIAAQKALGSPVRAFATTLVQDYGQANTNVNALLTSSGTWPLKSALSMSLASGSTLETAILQQLGTPAFDPIYLTIQIARHRQVLAMLDSQLLPAAQDPSLQTLVTQVRSNVAANLTQATLLLQTKGK